MCRKYLLINLFFYSSSLLRGVIFILMLCMLGLRTQALYAQKLDSTASVVPPRPYVNDSVTTKKITRLTSPIKDWDSLPQDFSSNHGNMILERCGTCFRKTIINHGIILHNMLRSLPLGDFMQRVLKDKVRGNV